LDTARVAIETEVADSPSVASGSGKSVTIVASENELNGRSSGNELDFNVSVVVVSGDVGLEDLDSIA